MENGDAANKQRNWRQVVIYMTQSDSVCIISSCRFVSSIYLDQGLNLNFYIWSGLTFSYPILICNAWFGKVLILIFCITFYKILYKIAVLYIWMCQFIFTNFFTASKKPLPQLPDPEVPLSNTCTVEILLVWLSVLFQLQRGQSNIYLFCCFFGQTLSFFSRLLPFDTFDNYAFSCSRPAPVVWAHEFACLQFGLLSCIWTYHAVARPPL